MADPLIVSLTASLVREYLSRKGLKSTLQTLDKEMPRTEDSISNRAQLAKEMHIERLMKKNKELPEPFRTMLEVIVQYMKDRDNQNLSSSVASDRSSQRSSSTRESKKEIRSRTTAQPSKNELIDKPDKEDDTNDRRDYDELLKQLEKPASNFHSASKTKLPNRTPVTKQKEEAHKGVLDTSELGGTLQSSSSLALGGTVQSSSGISSSVQMAKQKSKRRLNNSMGGPVVSSGLAAVRKDARTRHSTGRLSNSLTSKQLGSLFDGDEEESKELNVLQSQQQNVRDNKTDVLGKAQDFPLDRMDKDRLDRHQEAEDSPRHLRKSTSHKGSSRNQPVSNSRSQKVKSSDLVFEDIDDDLDQDLGQLTLGPRKIAPADVKSKPISLETAMGLKTLIFGNPKASFTPEWRNQSFSFCDLYGLEYGIVQLKGGPCGVLAAVQAFVLKHLLFGGKRGDTKKRLQPSSRERTKGLASAISEILWRAGDSKGAIVGL